MKKKEINVAVILFKPASELIIEASTSYYQMETKELLIGPSPTREHARKKSICFLLLKECCDLSSPQIATIAESTRQNVDYLINKAMGEVNVYTLSIRDYRAIKHIYNSLLKKQDELLEL